jgi:hypothetical protein
MANKILKLADHGQDFLEWHIDENGIVVGCWPFQSWVWNGSIVLNHKDIGPGDTIHFLNKYNQERTLDYPVVAVEVR